MSRYFSLAKSCMVHGVKYGHAVSPCRPDEGVRLTSPSGCQGLSGQARPIGVWSLRGLRPGRRESPVSAYQSMSFTARRIRSTAPSTPVRPALMTRS